MVAAGAALLRPVRVKVIVAGRGLVSSDIVLQEKNKPAGAIGRRSEAWAGVCAAAAHHFDTVVVGDGGSVVTRIPLLVHAKINRVFAESRAEGSSDLSRAYRQGNGERFAAGISVPSRNVHVNGMPDL